MYIEKKKSKKNKKNQKKSIFFQKNLVDIKKVSIFAVSFMNHKKKIINADVAQLARAADL